MYNVYAQSVICDDKEMAWSCDAGSFDGRTHLREPSTSMSRYCCKAASALAVQMTDSCNIYALALAVLMTDSCNIYALAQPYW